MRSTLVALMLVNVLLLSPAHPQSISIPRIPGFEENRGQGDPNTLFMSQYGDGTTLLRQDGIAIVPSGGKPLSMRLIGSAHAMISGVDPLPGVAHRYLGNDPSTWIVGARHYASVRYQGVYPGIDMLVQAMDDATEYSFHLAPGADPARIRLRFDRNTKLSIDASGALVIRRDERVIRHRPPRAYQGDAPVDVRFAIRKSTAWFDLGTYDHTSPLVIDPSIEFSSYLGGSGRTGASEFATDMALDSSGNLYILGSTQSTDFPSTGGTPVDPASCDQYFCKAKIFVTKFDPTGQTILYSVLFGGNGNETAGGLFVDANGNAWVTGTTLSNNFPTVNPYQASFGGVVFSDGDAFVTKLDSSGAIAWSTYLGGSTGDAGVAIAVDQNGSAYVAGRTDSYGFPTTNGAFQTTGGFGGYDAFITKFVPDGQSLAYSTLLGGSSSGNYSGRDNPFHIAVDSNGFAYVVGTTESPGFPVANAIQPAHAGGSCISCPTCACRDAFATKLSQTGTGLVYSTFLGGSGDDSGYGGFIDSSGDLFICGETSSRNFPVANAYQPAIAEMVNPFYTPDDAFITEINAAGNAIAYSTYFGGNGVDRANEIAVLASGEIHVAGTTHSSNLPTKFPLHAYKGEPANCYLIYGGDAFVTKFNSAGNGLVFSSYLGGTGADEATGLAVATTDFVYVSGQTCSSDFPTVSSYQSVKKGTQGNAFFAKIAAAGPAKGDVNGDGVIDAADIVYLVGFLLAGSSPPVGSADVNGDGNVTFADVFYLINNVFGGGPTPV